MENRIQRIIEIAVKAPSGHNYQPWNFRLDGNSVKIFNLPKRDMTIFNFKQRGSYIAHGAVIENIEIAAKAMGYAVDLTLFPDNDNSEFIASISFEETDPSAEPLYPSIFNRSTNRKPYKKISLNPEHRDKILDIQSKDGGPELQLSENPTEIKLLSKCFSLSEILIFENYTVHQSLFPHILWTGKENIAKKVGLYVKTLELPPPARVAFKIMRHWPVARLMGKLGMGKSVASQNAKIYSASSAIGLITTASNTPYDFIHVGRFLQRLWLTADSIGLCMQPLAGLVYIGHRIDEGDTEQFTPVQIELIREGYRRISEIFSVRPQSMALPFRIGYGGEPTSRSLHLSPRFL